MAEPKDVTVRLERLHIKHDGDRFGAGEIFVRFAVNDGESFFEGQIPEEGAWKLNDGDVRALDGPSVTFEETVRDIHLVLEVFDQDMTGDEALGEKAGFLVHRFAERYRTGTHVHTTDDYELTYSVEVH